MLDSQSRTFGAVAPPLSKRRVPTRQRLRLRSSTSGIARSNIIAQLTECQDVVKACHSLPSACPDAYWKSLAMKMWQRNHNDKYTWHTKDGTSFERQLRIWEGVSDKPGFMRACRISKRVSRFIHWLSNHYMDEFSDYVDSNDILEGSKSVMKYEDGGGIFIVERRGGNDEDLTLYNACIDAILQALIKERSSLVSRPLISLKGSKVSRSRRSSKRSSKKVSRRFR